MTDQLEVLPLMEARPKKLLDQVRDRLRVKHYAYKTEECYVNWIRRFILFHNKQHPNTMGSVEIEAFLRTLPSMNMWPLPLKIRRSAPYSFCIEKFCIKI